jgi:hypothetical protein
MNNDDRRALMEQMGITLAECFPDTAFNIGGWWDAPGGYGFLGCFVDWPDGRSVVAVDMILRPFDFDTEWDSEIFYARREARHVAAP